MKFPMTSVGGSGTGGGVLVAHAGGATPGAATVGTAACSISSSMAESLTQQKLELGSARSQLLFEQ